MTRAALLLPFLLLSPASVQACRCAPRSLSRHIEASPRVYEAEVRRVRVLPGSSRRVAEVTVSATWKGTNYGCRRIETPGVGMCGVDFRVGESYLIFATPAEEGGGAAGVDRTTTCDGSRPMTPGVRRLMGPVPPAPLAQHPSCDPPGFGPPPRPPVTPRPPPLPETAPGPAEAVDPPPGWLQRGRPRR